jgi:3-isopropylmalate/(R)-2-methylmalate dehydratase small subunit
MKPFETLTSRAIYLPVDNVDTDQIFPGRYLVVTTRDGLGQYLFADWRFDESGAERPEFALNRPEAEGRSILFAGRNFGSGSSREHAPWALTDFGFRVVIAPGFADIFRNNALKNGLLLVDLPEPRWQEVNHALRHDADVELTVDLHRRTLGLPGHPEIPFPIDDFSRECLVHGLDQVDYILSRSAAIDDFERRNPPVVNSTPLMQQEGRET